MLAVRRPTVEILNIPLLVCWQLLPSSNQLSSLYSAMFRKPVTPSSWLVFCKVTPVTHRYGVIKAKE